MKQMMHILQRLNQFFSTFLQYKPFRYIRLHLLARGVALLGLFFLAVVLGAGIMFYEWGPSSYFRKAFVAFDALGKRGEGPHNPRSPHITAGVSVDDPGETDDGFTLVTCADSPSAVLFDMTGQRVHVWGKPFSKAWQNPTHVFHPRPDDEIHWFRAHLYPNGDLLAIFECGFDTPHGYGLVKLDKDSNVLWTYSQNVHHDLDVGDDGKLYALSHQLMKESPAQLEFIEAPYLADFLVVLSPDGQELEKIPLLEALRDSQFSLLLSKLNHRGEKRAAELSPQRHAGGRRGPIVPMIPGHKGLPPNMPKTNGAVLSESGDIFHANSVRVLNPGLAAKFPLFKAGQVLISLRAMHTILVLDLPSRSVHWAAQGPWKSQHDAEFLDNGRLLIYDNFGYPGETRTLEYDPVTYALPWSYSSENSEPFVAVSGGVNSRLPNGNTLFVDPHGSRVLEISRQKKLVWQLDCHGIITGANRYQAGQLPFLQNRPPRP